MLLRNFHFAIVFLLAVRHFKSATWGLNFGNFFNYDRKSGQAQLFRTFYKCSQPQLSNLKGAIPQSKFTNFALSIQFLELEFTPKSMKFLSKIESCKLCTNKIQKIFTHVLFRKANTWVMKKQKHFLNFLFHMKSKHLPFSFLNHEKPWEHNHIKKRN